MYHLMKTLPVFGTLGVVALLAGPLARLPIDMGAWLLELLVRRVAGPGPEREGNGYEVVNSGPRRLSPIRRPKLPSASTTTAPTFGETFPSSL